MRIPVFGKGYGQIEEVAMTTPAPNSASTPSMPSSRRPAKRRGCAAVALGRSQTDRIRSHRHPAPVAAAALAASPAADRGRTDRALPRGHLGLLPADRPGGGAEVARGMLGARSIPSTGLLRATATARRSAGGARCRRAELFPRARRRVGSRPRAARRRRRGRRRDPRGSASATRPHSHLYRYGHRHRPDARTVCCRDRTGARARPVARHAGAGARPTRPRRLETSHRAPGRHLRLPLRTGSFDVVSCSGAALSTTAPARSARPRACCDPAAGCWWSTSRRMIWSFLRIGEHAHRRLELLRRDRCAMAASRQYQR